MSKILALSLVGVFLLAMASLSFAAPVTTFTFSDTVLDPGNLDWTHDLDNTDFSPNLSGGEVIEITSATLTIQIDLTLDNVGGFGLGVWAAAGDTIYLDTLVLTGDTDEVFDDYEWEIDLSTIAFSEDALNAIEDRSFTLQLVENLGTIDNIDSSILCGSGNVVPIPGSALLLGSGVFGLIILGCRRRSQKE